MVVLELPFPPSLNSYYRSPNVGSLSGRTLISKKGREYRRKVILASRIGAQRAPEGRLEVHIQAFPPDRRRRDLDNMLKALLDGMTHASVFEDDSLIDVLSVERFAPCPGGKVRVFISAHEPEV
ncbi:RusA family crossover junction endodeoxyribonuclease [Schauerella aestuarii]|uniref:RusA family crossover junction endodeoxyribonuclease n=1 Tax=Schauerella aestuarii TaxID=2511204 RepID=UPI00136EE6FF|nr:RusA family crossover junction endodeoxyribonuclease [Achromobacter aestuarii]MYZ44198.1 RusA family crossover junction endodeoxyribonuclease [Achromobacter aestuarii]